MNLKNISCYTKLKRIKKSTWVLKIICHSKSNVFSRFPSTMCLASILSRRKRHNSKRKKNMWNKLKTDFSSTVMKTTIVILQTLQICFCYWNVCFAVHNMKDVKSTVSKTAPILLFQNFKKLFHGIMN